MDSVPYSELDISAGFQRGERWAFDAAARSYFAPIVNFVASLLQDRDSAVDLAQEAFFLAFRAHHKVDMSRPIAPWLFQIARNLAYKEFNKRKKQMNYSWDAVMEENATELTALDVNPRHESVTLEIRERIQRALARLAPKYRDIITLRMIQGLPSEQVSQLLQIPVATVNTRIHRALKILKRYARQEGLQEEEFLP